MLKVVRWLAIVSLVVAVLFDIAVYLGLLTTFSVNGFVVFTVDGLSSLILFRFAYSTTLLLCFVAGTLALVPAAQRRHRVWFAVLLVWLLIASYAPLAMQAYWDTLTAGYEPGSLPPPSLETAALIYPFANYVAPEIPALIALLYTLFTRPRYATSLPSDDVLDVLEIQITSLHTSENVQ
jgi:hypothetical protein